MLDQNELTSRSRLPSTAGTAAGAVERVDDQPDSSLEEPAPAPGDETEYRCCPVCEFASAEDDDVYIHLMTAHRKSTISSMLLDRL